MRSVRRGLPSIGFLPVGDSRRPWHHCAPEGEIAACRESAVAPQPIVELRTSFESGLDAEWTVGATDTLVVEAGIPWWVRPSTTMAADGRGSLEFFMANYTDAAKIWIARPVTVPPGRAYRVTIRYMLGTADDGDVNRFALLTGVTTAEPRTAADLEPAFRRDETWNGGSVGYRWVEKQFESDVTADATGRLYVVVGAWGTWETSRTYYMDALHVWVAPR